MTTLFERLLGQRAPEDLPGEVRAHLDLKKRFDPDTPIAEAEFVAFDTELTGLDFRRDSIISVGALRMRGDTILMGESFYRLVRPESRLNGESVVVHEITREDLVGAGQAGDVLSEFLGFIGDAVLIGHFVHIDLNFVNRAMKRHFGSALRSMAVDTLSIHDWLYENDSSFARHFGGMTVKKDLYSMARSYGIRVEASHNALYDAFMTAQLFQRFFHFLPGCGVNTVGELLQIGKS
ncbi:MAG: 3'-5' exonuclease [Thermodesulfovibrionales bacterium]